MNVSAVERSVRRDQDIISKIGKKEKYII